MSDIKLFDVRGGDAVELKGASVAIEKSLQDLVERHLDAFLGIRFLASEYSTGKLHGGRIDTLGVDENNSPVIIEYKRAVNENVTTQGLYYLDWLLDHRAEFELLTMKKLGESVSSELDWSAPRLLCIAGDFKKYDEHAVRQINRNIELIRYKQFGDQLILLDLVNSSSSDSSRDASPFTSSSELVTKVPIVKTIEDRLGAASPEVQDRFDSLCSYLMAMGDDVQMRTLKHYFAFRRIRNFVCVEVHPQAGRLKMYLKVDPASVNLETGFSRDVSTIGHYGTGELEVIVDDDIQLERAKPLILRSYESA
jgi:predicted transport protein